MSKITEQIELGYRVTSIRRVKRALYLVQIAIVLVFAAYLLVASGGFKLKPFYFSINTFIYFVILMLLIISIESFVFTILEMRFIKSQSAKNRMARQQIKRSFYVIAVAIVVIAIIWLPFISDSIADMSKKSGDTTAASSISPTIVTFSNNDVLGITNANNIDLKSSGAATVYIVSEDNYNKAGSDMGTLAQYRVNILQYECADNLTITLPDMTHNTYYMLIYSNDNSSQTVSYTINSDISNTLSEFVPLLMLFFIVAYAAWGVYLVLYLRKYGEKTAFR